MKKYSVLIVPVLLTFCTLMSISYYKNNYKTVVQDYSLKAVSLGQAKASTEAPKVSPRYVYYKNYNLNNQNKSKENNPKFIKKISKLKEQRMFVEDVR